VRVIAQQGQAEFSDDDEEIVVALAAAAGVAIDNARLFAIARRRERWLAAAAEITSVLLGTVRRTEALRLIARRAREVADADLVMVLLHDAGSARYTIEVADGADPGCADLVGRIVPMENEWADRFGDDKYRIMDDLRGAAEWPGPVPDGPALAAPLAGADTRHGVLIVAHRAGRAQRMDDDAAPLSSFAGQAALALERARAQEERDSRAPRPTAARWRRCSPAEQRCNQEGTWIVMTAATGTTRNKAVRYTLAGLRLSLGWLFP
jgi:GAF domain-containing protein